MDVLNSSDYLAAIDGIGFPIVNPTSTSAAKSKRCKKRTQTTRLSKTSPVDLTGIDADLKPYWTESAAALSKSLWSPTVIDFADFGSSLLNGSADGTLANSWFSTTLAVNPNRSLSKTSLPSSTSSRVEFTDDAGTVRRTKKIRLYPTSEQKQLLKQWCGVARWFYNQAVANDVSKRFAVQSEMLKNAPEWTAGVPYKVRQMAIEDECIARKNGFKFAKKTGQSFKLSFRSRKLRRDSLYIPKQAVTTDSIYPRKLGKMKSAEPLGRPEFDCRLLHENGKYYLLVPHSKPKRENQADGFVAIDPGVRTFVTFFSPDVVGKIASMSINRIQRLCEHMDKLQSRRKWRVVRRMRARIKNLISELHHKTALWFTKNFDTIIIPKFNAREMTIRGARKIRSKTARKMLTLAHGRFRQILLDKCEEFGRLVIHVSEAYTSKTCSVCGQVHDKLGGRKTLKCCADYDRDINGARGIFLRALADTPVNSLNLCAV